MNEPRQMKMNYFGRRRNPDRKEDTIRRIFRKSLNADEDKMAGSAAYLLVVETIHAHIKNNSWLLFYIDGTIFVTFYFKCNIYPNFEMILKTKGNNRVTH